MSAPQVVLHLPWRRRMARVVLPRGETGWAVLIPPGASPRLVGATVAWLQRRGAREITLSPQVDPGGRGLVLWMAAALQAGLLLAARAGTPQRALVVGVDTPAGQLALGWLAARVRYLSAGQHPGHRQVLAANHLLDDLGMTLTWIPVDAPGPPWEGDLVVWAGAARPLRREVSAPVWVQVAPELPREQERRREGAVVMDTLVAGVGMKGVPRWWWRDWGWPEGLLPAGGLEAALRPGGKEGDASGPGAGSRFPSVSGYGRSPPVPAPARQLDRAWQEARRRGWSLAAAVLADGAGRRKVAWLTGMRGAHIIGNAIG